MKEKMTALEFSRFAYNPSVKYDLVFVPLSNVEESILRAAMGYEVSEDLGISFLALAGNVNKEIPETEPYRSTVEEYFSAGKVLLKESESRTTEENLRNVRDQYLAQHEFVKSILFVVPNYMGRRMKFLAKRELPGYDIGVLGFDAGYGLYQTAVRYAHEDLSMLFTSLTRPGTAKTAPGIARKDEPIREIMEFYKIIEKVLQNDPEEFRKSLGSFLNRHSSTVAGITPSRNQNKSKYHEQN